MTTTTTTIIGLVTDELGAAVQTSAVQGRHGPELRRHFSAVGANQYRNVQPDRIDLEIDHDRRVGRVLHLERRHGNLWAVAEIDTELGPVPPAAVYFSPTITTDDDGTDIEMRSLSLTATPATIGAEPVHELLGNIRHACQHSWRLRNRFLTEILEHARDNKTGPGRIHGDPAPVPDHPDDVEYEQRFTRATAYSSGRWMRLPDGDTAEVEIRPAKITHVRGVPVGVR